MSLAHIDGKNNSPNKFHRQCKYIRISVIKLRGFILVKNLRKALGWSREHISPSGQFGLKITKIQSVAK